MKNECVKYEKTVRQPLAKSMQLSSRLSQLQDQNWVDKNQK